MAIEQYYLEHRHYFQQNYWNSKYFLLRMLTTMPHRVINVVAKLIENHRIDADIIEKYEVDIS